MRVTIDQSGQDDGLTEIDSYRAIRGMVLDPFPRTDFLDALAFRQNSLIEQVSPTLDVEHAASFDQFGSWRRRWFEPQLRRRSIAESQQKANGIQMSTHGILFF